MTILTSDFDYRALSKMHIGQCRTRLHQLTNALASTLPREIRDIVYEIIWNDIDVDDFDNIATTLTSRFAIPKNSPEDPSVDLIPSFLRPGMVSHSFAREFSEFFYERFRGFIVLDVTALAASLTKDHLGLGSTPSSSRLSKLTICASVDDAGIDTAPMAIGSLLVTELQGETIHRVPGPKALSDSLSILYDGRQKLASRFELIVRLISNTKPWMTTPIYELGDGTMIPEVLAKHTAKRLNDTLQVIKRAEEQLKSCCAFAEVRIQIELADRMPFIVTEDLTRKNVRGWVKVLRGLETPV
ncbi:hypothetical protein FB567DRAFT_317341 [Paraphoma chrysanthemicola]|uniref:Uncharacterized protein n=1 Tax=Paraphoma chrysanthemicola TaxID=798071 RepID=A0A8K0VZ60_9PLEO|nr:hypothetical protein FB567DRAFT_317341 [Paraphoma chrysanthemicola]